MDRIPADVVPVIVSKLKVRDALALASTSAWLSRWCDEALDEWIDFGGDEPTILDLPIMKSLTARIRRAASGRVETVYVQFDDSCDDFMDALGERWGHTIRLMRLRVPVVPALRPTIFTRFPQLQHLRIHIDLAEPPMAAAIEYALAGLSHLTSLHLSTDVCATVRTSIFPTQLRSLTLAETQPYYDTLNVPRLEHLEMDYLDTMLPLTDLTTLTSLVYVDCPRPTQFPVNLRRLVVHADSNEEHENPFPFDALTTLKHLEDLTAYDYDANFCHRLPSSLTRITIGASEFRNACQIDPSDFDALARLPALHTLRFEFNLMTLSKEFFEFLGRVRNVRMVVLTFDTYWVKYGLRNHLYPPKPPCLPFVSVTWPRFKIPRSPFC